MKGISLLLLLLLLPAYFYREQGGMYKPAWAIGH